MRKRILCLVMGLVMLLGVCTVALTSCSKDAAENQENIQNQASARAITLSMYIMSEKPVDENTEKEIEDAVNRITEKKYKTRLDLRFFTEEAYFYYEGKDANGNVGTLYQTIDSVNANGVGEMIIDFDGAMAAPAGITDFKVVRVAGYYEQIDKAFADRDEARKNGTIVTLPEDDGENSDETEDESGHIQIIYPEIADYQVDIFYMGGEDNFLKYKNDNRLTKLDDELTGSSKILNTNISPQYLAHIKSLNNGTYAIPTSKVIGEYTYLLLNKAALADEYRSAGNGVSNAKNYTSLTCADVEDFLNYTLQHSDNKDYYYGIYTNLSQDELLINNIKYWGVDENGDLSDAFSILGGYFNDKDDYLSKNTYAKIENLFENKNFLSDLKTLKYYESENYIHYQKQANKSFAVGYVTGGAELVEEYGDEYELVPISTPRLTEGEIYSDMYAVGAHTANVGRSMQIICMLNTDVNFRNLILYGIEGKHYRLHDTKIKDEYGDNIMAGELTDVGKAYYNIDINKTGNTFTAYPIYESNYNIRSYGVKQNQIAKVDIALGFKLNYGNFRVNVASEGEENYSTSLKNVQALSDKILKEYRECSYEDIDKFIENAQKEIRESEAVKYHLSCTLGVSHEADGTVKDNSELVCGSLSCCYQAWLVDKKIISK